MNTYKYRFRLTKRNFYDGSVAEIIGTVDAHIANEAVEKVKEIAIRTEVMLSASQIIKVEYESPLEQGRWFDITEKISTPSF